MRAIKTVAVISLVLIIAVINTRPSKWAQTYLGMEGEIALKILGEPDQSGFEEFYWTSSFNFFGIELFGNYLKLGISPGRDQRATPRVVDQSLGYTLFGRDIFKGRE